MTAAGPAAETITRAQAGSELDALLWKAEKAGLHSEFLAGLRAAKRHLTKPADEPWHGTPSGYNHHKCRRACCREAIRRYRESLKGGPRPASPPPRFVGKVRCSECRRWCDPEQVFTIVVAARRRAFCKPECHTAFARARGLVAAA